MSPASGYMGAKYFQEFGQKYMPVLSQEYMLFFCLPLSSQPRLRLLRPLSISQHTGRTREGRGHILLAEDGHIFLTCLQLVGTWVKNIFRNLVPDFLTCPQLVGTWVKNMFRNLVPHFLAHTPWRIPPYEKYPRKGVLAHGHMSMRQHQTFVTGSDFDSAYGTIDILSISPTTDISRTRKRYRHLQGPLKNSCPWQTELRRPF